MEIVGLNEIKNKFYYRFGQYQIMSKLNIRFIYNNPQQNIRTIKSLPKLPTHIPILNQAYPIQPIRPIQIINNNFVRDTQKQGTFQFFQKLIPVVPSVQINSKNNSPQLSKNLEKSPVNKIEELNFASNNDLNQQQSKQKELVKKTKPKERPTRQVQTFIPDAQIVLKSPSFKYVPKQEGELNHGNRKEYIRAEKSQKYLFKGIPQKSENDFIGCFGCFEKKPKTFMASHK